MHVIYYCGQIRLSFSRSGPDRYSGFAALVGLPKRPLVDVDIQASFSLYEPPDYSQAARQIVTELPDWMREFGCFDELGPILGTEPVFTADGLTVARDEASNYLAGVDREDQEAVVNALAVFAQDAGFSRWQHGIIMSCFGISQQEELCSSPTP